MTTFNLTWNQTLKLNYATFNHRCKYIAHKHKEERREMKKAQAKAKAKR